ncbi:MAG: ABC transporter ATP-binding protein [Deltaproteobacteria bacterium]|nr:ABC transporter ATP-binding protein [Candidatus Zymogenaceae bacterium]
MALIRVQNVCKSFFTDGKKVDVLRGIDLSVARGEVINILGASGAGKSTLLYILGALDRPTSGTVVHDGVSLFAMGDRDLAAFRNRKIGFVFQFHHLLPEFTAVENVMMPALIARIKPAEAKKRAEAILDRLGLADRCDHKPGELSGGEQQRVAVARAILLSPDVILADEPTGNLDTKTGEEVHKVLMDLNRELKITMIIVTHNLKLAKRDGRSVILEDGKIRDGR